MERHQSQGAASNSTITDVPSGDAGETWRNVSVTAAPLVAVSRGLFSAAALAFTGSSGPPPLPERWAGVGVRGGAAGGWRNDEKAATR